MIREFQIQDLDRVMQIWLETNIDAHNFIEADFFERNYDLVKILITGSKILVQIADDEIQGFIGFMDDYIAGLFVDKKYQGRGFGTLLIEEAKKNHNELYAHVYKQNERAISFYKKQGFNQLEERLNEETGLPELLMGCTVNHNIKIGKCAL